MDGFLRQSTGSQIIKLGRFVDSTDGDTAETGLSIANTDIKLHKNGASAVSKNSGGATHDADGWYAATLDTTDTNTVGRLMVTVSVSGALYIKQTFEVLEEAVYDALFASSATGALPATLVQGGINTAAGTITTLDGLDTAQDSQHSSTQSTLSTIASYVDTEVAAIKAKTDNLPASPAAVGSEMTLADGAITAAKIATDAITAAKIATDAVSEIQSGLATAAKLLAYIQLLVRKDAAITTDNATELSELNADGGSGAGSYAATTDALEALRDRGDSAWATATGFSTHSAADVWTSGTRTLTAFSFSVDLNADQSGVTIGTCTTNTDMRGTDSALLASSAPTNFSDLAITASTGLVSVGTIATSGLADLFDTDSGTTYASAVSGSVVKEIADNAGGSALTAEGIADAVWDEAQSGHTTAGTFGKYLDSAVSGVSSGGVSAADIADAVLDEALSGHTTAGTLGKAISDTLVDTNSLNDTKIPQTLNLTASGNIGIDWANVENASSSVDLSSTAINLCDTVTTNTDMRGTDSAYTGTPPTAVQIRQEIDTNSAQLVAIDAEVVAIKAVTDNLPNSGALTSLATAAQISALNNLSSADVNAACDTALADYDGPTNAEMVAAFTQIKGATWDTTDTLEAIRNRGDAAWATATGFSTHSAADVWAAGTRTLTGFSFSVDLNADQSGVTIGTCTTNTDMRGTDSAYTGTPPTSSAIADAVWDESAGDHATSGSTGEKLAEKTGFKLASDGLDSIVVTNPADGDPSTWTFPERVVMLCRRFFSRVVFNRSGGSGTIKVYDDDETTQLTTQTTTETSDTQTVGESS